VRLQVDKIAASGWCWVCVAKLLRKRSNVLGNWSTANANLPRKSSGAVVWFNPNAHTAMIEL
jgi:hypothetical protein